MSLDDETVRRVTADTNDALQRWGRMGADADARNWLVTVPPYNADGLLIEQFVITEEQARLDKLRAAFNPQRGDRSIDSGTYTRMTVDGEVWMTDTPAECRDLREVDEAMARYEDASMLIVGLGLGVVLQRAIAVRRVRWIDVVEIDERVIKAVGPHYQRLAEEHDVGLHIHHTDIHAWRLPPLAMWDIGWFDIWAHINTDDMPEVKRLRDRFRKRLEWFGAWAQPERIAAKRRVASGKWAY